ncbi:Zinc finger RING-type [Arabidopsis thaliana x Arabidopsis arenosa]|uniref:Zinc finger RING-type n=1 Tax=Arabidopsis thaliana x Arabidopsis arenosa TaxID=1240361 RepID=A0A8T1Y4B1_9BRAS|nr:Zinc finger RING-type [Arabidopsis thaliana x Arabidopsis arenosa]
MADTSHLERMGRELKCPICLSLFNSAVSLSCNHVFCNACIVKSMKMDATCPVCKIPYHRREIRGAPHMDSLVSIYKNMEDASGVNLFVSQNNPSPSDKEKQVRDASIGKASDKNRQGSRKARTSKRKEYGKTKETDVDAPGPIVMKPSSQTKKRVQLLQNLSSESLTKPTESVETAENTKDYTENTVIRLDEHHGLNKEENLSPFFWLRDEDDGENSSQRTESDQLLDAKPVDVPSFSDLMDSDHESPSKADEQEKPNLGDMFDSEMFEWTQRPCSPEILPSPVKAKVLRRGDIDLPQKKLSKVASSKCKNGKAGSARKKVATRSVEVSKEDNMESSAVANISEKQDSRGTSGTIIRNDGNPDENVKAKRATRSKGQRSRVQSDLNVSKEADGKQGTKRKRSSIKSSPAHPIAGSNELSLGTEIVGKGDQDRAHESSDTHPAKQSLTEKPSLKKRGRKFNASSSLEDLSGKTQKKTSEKRLKLDSPLTSSKATQSHGNGILTDELNQVGDKQDSTNKKKSTVGKDNHTMQVLEKCSAINKSSSGGSAHLRRCDGPSTKKFTCAFCQSSEDTEASGEMAHYHRGEPVSADFNGGSKVIHVHKNCAEWAPNVYFNNLTVVNLDVELTRSRRISCSCCGLKGAALGCYNKSCKNSFHVTCAKLIPECRWDNENFVMLCPLDASIKLPCEETNSKDRKCKRTPKGPLNSQPNQVSGKTSIAELQSKQFHGLSKKLVLSCSGLTVEEKTVITEFEELTGVTISKNWEPTVTHVIASINENGACKRTLKFMMAILEGKWILTIDWIKACMKNTKYVSEEPYEITMDVHGIREGPHLGRQRALKKKPKLFNGLKFYIMGDFELAYKGYLQDLIVAAGGTILRRRPVSSDDNEASTIVVFSVEPSKKKTLTQRRSDAEALAKSARARAASSSWVLDSIAGCQILDLI